MKNINSYTCKQRFKAVMLGEKGKKGLLEKIFCYTLLVLFAFVYMYPMLYMLAYSFMSQADVVNPIIKYLPSGWYIDNYTQVIAVIDYLPTLLQTLLVAVAPAILQTISTMLVAYGLARFRFAGRKLILVCVVVSFIVPQQVTLIPQLILYKELGLLDSLMSFLVPAALGQGIKSAIFILIFYQFFAAVPNSVIEAAKIDGAGDGRVFFSIGVPAAKPAILLVFLLSVVWYYNETVLSAIYFGGSITTLPLELAKLKASFDAVGGGTSGGASINEAIYMAGTLLSIIPLIIMYFFTQKYFVEGIDKAGITGE